MSITVVQTTVTLGNVSASLAIAFKASVAGAEVRTSRVGACGILVARVELSVGTLVHIHTDALAVLLKAGLAVACECSSRVAAGRGSIDTAVNALGTLVNLLAASTGGHVA
jgi:hypothetical protein